jgi:hypothetical protein
VEYLVFRSSKSQNRVVIPATQSMVVDRSDGSVVIYAIGGNGRDRMVWEVPEIGAIRVCQTMGQALNLHLPGERGGTARLSRLPDTGRTEVLPVARPL